MRAVIYIRTSNPTLRNHQLARCQQLVAKEHYHVVLTLIDTGVVSSGIPHWIRCAPWSRMM